MSTSTPRLLGGRYEVGELIGRGGMAEVHLGHDTRLSRPVAIKILRSDHARDASFLHRFRREAQSVAGLNHRSIVAVYDSGEDQVTESGGAVLDIPYIVMEYVDGRTLRELLNEHGRLDPDEAARICAAVLDALAYSHQMGIVHRDIKPGNVMVGDDGSVKVMDFGIARAVADAQATMTQTAAVIGTAQYISPEQARGETVDNRSDIYSTGCLLFELLTGRTPFVGEPIALTYQHVNAAVPLPSELVPEVPVELDAVVRHALTKDRDERYQDAQEMAEDLEAYRQGMPVSPAAMASLGTDEPTEVYPGAVAAGPTVALDPPTAVDGPIAPPVAREPERRRRGAWGWVIAALLLIPLLALGWYAWQASQPEPVQQVSVPQLVGKDQDRAEQEIRELGLYSDVTLREDKKPAGEVLEQRPTPGSRVDPGNVVALTVSSGIGETRVPDLSGMTRAEAKDALQEVGLEIGEVSKEDSPDQDKDRVIRSEPASGTDLAKGSKVAVVLSTGKVELPDLIGQSIDDASSKLYELGLKLRTKDTESDKKPGTVLSQDPTAGKVARGSTVTLEVATKPAPTVTTTTTPSPTTSDPTTTEDPPMTTQDPPTTEPTTPDPTTTQDPTPPEDPPSPS